MAGTGVEDVVLDGTCGKRVIEIGTIQDAKEELVYMDGVGILVAGVQCDEATKTKLLNAQHASIIIIGTGSGPMKQLEVPKRYRTPAGKAKAKGWNALSPELKNKVHEYVLASQQGNHIMDATFDLYKELAWAFVNKENYREYMPLYYANVNMRFDVMDFDFSEVTYFITSISNQARLALLKNTNLNVHMTFTSENIHGYMLAGTRHWLKTCKGINKKIQTKPFNGVRIPWVYHAYDDDMFTHLNWETKVAYWPRQGDEWEEIEKIKKAFHEAPLLRV